MDFELTNLHNANISDVKAAHIKVGTLTGLPGVITIPEDYIEQYLDIHLIDAADGLHVVIPHVHNMPMLRAISHWHDYGEDHIKRRGTSLVKWKTRLIDNFTGESISNEGNYDILDIRAHRREHVIPAVIAGAWQACWQSRETENTWKMSRMDLITALLYLQGHEVDLSAVADKANQYHHALSWPGPELDVSSLMCPLLFRPSGQTSRSNPKWDW